MKTIKIGHDGKVIELNTNEGLKVKMFHPLTKTYELENGIIIFPDGIGQYWDCTNKCYLQILDVKINKKEKANLFFEIV